MVETENREGVGDIIKILKRKYLNVRIALKFSNPLEILISTILSAQCTDERVNKVTADLFKKYRKASDYANANLKEFEKEIKSTGFYRNKAKNIIKACNIIVKDFNSEIPRTMEELIKLPGVARKTANVVLYSAYGINGGIAVDTHVRRLSQRLKLTRNDNPEKIERDLMDIVPKKDWGRFSLLLIQHGREICQAKKPLCRECVLNKICPSFKIFIKS